MKRFTFAVMAATLGLAGAAQAQSDLIPSNVNIRVGFIYPTEDDVRDFTGYMFGLGVDINTNISLIKGNTGYFSVDFMSGTLNGDKGTFLPIMYNQRFNLGAPVAGRDAYLLGGLGMVNIDLVRGKFVFGGRVGIGASLTEKTFLEATFLFSDDVDGARANSLGIHYGFRF